MTRLVQIQDGSTRRVALVEEPHLHLLAGFSSIYKLAKQAAESGSSLLKLIQEKTTGERIPYEPIYNQESGARLLLPVDHPVDPARCIVSGTGLTHLGSAKNRQAMHGAAESGMNDSMKMFKWGVEGGHPAPGTIGVSPEWFYKGNGAMLRAHGEPLTAPAFAEGCGEEGEIAGVYLIGADGVPLRIGMAIGNEFSDHVFEKKNYLNLAGSKLRNCSLGPELVVDPEFQTVPGMVRIERAGSVLWSKEIVTGESEMCHSLANIEHHHFKFVELADGDIMDISFAGFGRPLRNPLRIVRGETKPVAVKSLY
jgi:hypothetical protein